MQVAGIFDPSSKGKSRRDALLSGPTAHHPQPVHPPQPEPVTEPAETHPIEENKVTEERPAEPLHDEDLLSWALGEEPNKEAREGEVVAEETVQGDDVLKEAAEGDESSQRPESVAWPGPRPEKSQVRFQQHEEEEEEEEEEEGDSDERKLVEEESRRLAPERSETFKRLTNGIRWPKGASFMRRSKKEIGSRELAISTTFKDSSRQAIHAAITGKTEVILEAEKAVLKKLLYVSQGRLDHYTEEAMQKRYELRDDPSIKDSVKKWWAWLPKGEKNSQVPYPHITRGVYFAWVVMIQMVLLPRFGMKADLDYDPTGDWEDDKVSDLNVLNYQAFFKALFKVPDLWCDGVEASDYTKLLNELLEEAQKRTALWNRLLHRYGAMDQNGPKRVIGFGASAAKNLLLVSTDVAAAKKFGSMLGASSSNSPQASSKTNPFGKPPASPKPDSSLEDSPKAAAEPTTSKAAPWVWKNPQPSPRPPGLEPSPSPMASSGGGKFLRGNPPTPLVPFLGTSQPSSSPAASAGGRFYTISSPSPNPRPSPLLEPALSAATPQRPSTLSVAPKGAKPPPVNLPNISSSAQSPPDRRSPKAASKGDQPLLPPTSPRPPPTPDDQTVGLMPDSVSSPSHIPFTALELEHEHEHPYQLEKEKVEPDVNPQPQQLDGHAIEGTRQLPAFEEKRDQGGPLSLRVEQMLTDDTTGGPTLSPWSFSEGVDDRLNHQLASTSRTPSNHLVPWGPRASTAAEGAVRVSHSGSLMDGKWYAGGLSPNRVTTASRERRVSQTGPPLTLNPPLTLKLDKDNDNQAQTQQLLVNVPKWVTKPSEAPPPPPAITVDSPSSSPPPKSYGIRNVWETTLLLPSSVDSGRKGVARSSWAGHGTNSPTYSYIWAPPRTSYNNSPRFQSPLWQNMSITPSGNASSGRPNINQSSDGSNPYQPSPTSPTGQGAADRVSPTGGSLHKGRSRWASSSGTFDQTRTRVSYGGGSSESSRLLRPSMSGGPGGEQLQPRMSGGIGENNMPRVGAASTWMNVDRTSPSQASNVELNSLDLFAQAFPKPLGAKQQQPGQITQFQKRFSTDGQKR